MFRQITEHYFTGLDTTLRDVVSTLPDEPGFGVMLRYALGWVDAEDHPYHEATGKRLRPILLLLCAECAGGEWQDALPAAAAVELLHNFSLIHDDIQDNSPRRHGRPTLWKVWGTANAINAGDAMFTLAYTALARLSQQFDAERVVRVWHIFNQTNLELTRGQHLDMRFEHLTAVTVDEYISMIRGKSAALLAACAQMGALIASGDETQAARYADFGLNIGIAFQIRDDILGIWGDPAITGKSAATDILSRKKSLPVLYGLEHSEELRELYNRELFGEDEVQRAVHLLDQLGAYDYAVQQEEHYHRRAVQALASASPQEPAATYLHRFVEMLFARSY